MLEINHNKQMEQQQFHENSVIQKQIATEQMNCNSTAVNEDDFASAFPEWNLLPPSMVIKRVKRVL